MRFAVIGDPIAQSKSPAMHTAAYRALGLGHSYEALRVPSSELEATIGELRAGTYDGFNVTVPHKVDVLSYVDDVQETALAIGAANTLTRDEEGRIKAWNTDATALGFVFAPAVTQGSDRYALVIGTGGAARAARWALQQGPWGKIIVRGRRFGPASAWPDLARDFDVDPLVPTEDDARLGIIVQTSSVGMKGSTPKDRDAILHAVDWARVPKDAFVNDVIYGVDTPFLRAARSYGLAHTDGSHMLAIQGALAFSLWLGFQPPVEIMQAALERASAP